MLTEYQKSRIDFILSECDVDDYHTSRFEDLGLHSLLVRRGVLPPDKTITSPLLARFLYENPTIYKNKKVLEIGSGTGILSLVMARHGASKVVATDIMAACVTNTKENAKRLDLGAIIDARHGDLFDPVRGEKFDVIFFAHPFYCQKPHRHSGLEVAIMDDGGLIKRFLTQARDYLNSDGKIFLPFNDTAGDGNHPKIHATDHGYAVDPRKVSEDDQSGLFVYELKPL